MYFTNHKHTLAVISKKHFESLIKVSLFGSTENPSNLELNRGVCARLGKRYCSNVNDVKTHAQEHVLVQPQTE